MNITALQTVWFETYTGDRVPTTVLAGEALTTVPEWTLLDVSAVPEDGDGETCGSEGFSYDTFAFRTDTLRLVGVGFSVPDAGYDEAKAESWLHCPAAQGTLRLAEVTGFGVERVDQRCFLEDHDVLLGVNDGTRTPEARLALGNGIELLVAEGTYTGWLLRNATARLATPFRSNVPHGAVRSDAAARSALGRVLRLVEGDASTRLRRGDTTLRDEVLRCHDQLRPALQQNGVYEILYEWIEDWLGESGTHG